MESNYKSKYTLLLTAILDISCYTVKANPFALKITQDNGLDTIPLEDLQLLIKHLVSNEAIEVIQDARYGSQLSKYDPYSDPDQDYIIRILDKVFLQNELIRSDDASEEETASEHNYYIVLTEDGRILLDGKFEIAKPNFNSENELVFRYLYDNPNQRHTKKHIEEHLKIKMKKTFHKTVENLNFRSGLKKYFFDISKNGIIFKNHPPSNT